MVYNILSFFKLSISLSLSTRFPSFFLFQRSLIKLLSVHHVCDQSCLSSNSFSIFKWPFETKKIKIGSSFFVSLHHKRITGSFFHPFLVLRFAAYNCSSLSSSIQYYFSFHFHSFLLFIISFR
jgi:hypothetical protein